MFSIAAITANNGWAQALTGGLIVMSGLSILSLIISQLHKLVEVLDKKQIPAEETQASAPSADTLTQAIQLDKGILEDLTTTAQKYQPITTELGEIFALSDLYRLLQKHNLPHPHLTLRAFREAGYLTPKGDGQFSWAKI